ncbi:MAG TPA: glucosaminidase domain-containing protein [Terriglobales bacterium]|nr:glucosaminidase domain-containing protein [Terriglobales bacterium]
MTKEEFIALATEAALACSRVTGFPAGITVAQAALESAWGQSRLSREANNYFGIKAHGNGPFVELPTSEVRGGKAIRCRARFARYDSMQTCFADRDHLIATLSCYAEARACAGDPEAFIRALARYWATDPQYAEKVLALYRNCRLGALDQR